jgi:ElaB/YqjD/DUF883 family membrane-anchored ribosome-binding protein
MNMQHTTTDAGLEAGRARLAQDIAAIASEAAELIKDTSGHNLRLAKEALAKARTAIRGGSKDAAEATGEFVHSHPLQAIGVAAAIGLLAGVLLARR